MTDDPAPQRLTPGETRLMSKDQTALYLGISVRYLELRTANETIPGFRPLGPRMPRWDRVVLDRWIDCGAPKISDTEFNQDF